jgi:hypothetical protein
MGWVTSNILVYLRGWDKHNAGLAERPWATVQVLIPGANRQNHVRAVYVGE